MGNKRSLHSRGNFIFLPPPAGVQAQGERDGGEGEREMRSRRRKWSAGDGQEAPSVGVTTYEDGFPGSAAARIDKQARAQSQSQTTTGPRGAEKIWIWRWAATMRLELFELWSHGIRPDSAGVVSAS